MAIPTSNSKKIFIGNLDPSTTHETIQNYFEQYGELSDCLLLHDKVTGKSRGFGFIAYKDSFIVDIVLDSKHTIDGKQIDCKLAASKGQSNDAENLIDLAKSRKIFAGGLSQDVTQEMFVAYFEQFGTVEDAVIMVDKQTGKPRGFGFVTFSSEDAVDKVINNYNDNKIDGKWIECRRVQSKSQTSSGQDRED